jgi:L-alanine-DL-glutamate epimerase-like enolase superfamily enzyme
VQSQLDAAAGAHFYASNPAAATMPAAEFIFGLGVGGADPLVAAPALTITDGHVDVPAAPGLGVAIDEGLLKQRTLMHEVVA